MKELAEQFMRVAEELARRELLIPEWAKTEGLHAEPVGNSGSTPDDATAGPPNRDPTVPLRSVSGEEGRR